jgi:tripartite-type tricarboxylate transporter receptor subunit TctC
MKIPHQGGHRFKLKRSAAFDGRINGGLDGFSFKSDLPTRGKGMKKIRSYTHILLAMTTLIAFCSLSGAQTYPTKPIRVVNPSPPGGAAEAILRPIIDKMAEKLGQPIIMDYRTGAGLTIGTAYVAKSPPDGYTLMEGIISGLTINPTLYKNIPYDPVKDFAPISLIARLPAVLIMHPSVPAKNLKELIALVKSSPGKLS